MSCSCSSGDRAHDHQRKVDGLFEAAGLSEIIEQGRAAIEEAGRSLDQLIRAERATALGFATEVSSIHLGAAKRANERAREQARTVLARIDDLAKQDLWISRAIRVKREFMWHGGPRKLQNVREDVRVTLLDDESGASANIARLSLATLDRAIDAASEGDLDRLLGHLRAVMAAALEGFDAPAMGRQSVGLGLLGSDESPEAPGIRGGADAGWCAALAACYAWAMSSLIAATLLCGGTPFCWCCYQAAVAVTFIAHLAACSGLFLGRCSGG